MNQAISARGGECFAHPLICERHAYLRTAIRAGCFMALGSFVLSCSPHPPLSLETSTGQGSGAPPDYSVVCMIHGDGSYLYHDTDGNDYKADEQALAGTLKVAQQDSHAEVFIFHQKRRRHFLLVFPRKDGDFYYYRNGRLLAHESYWRDQGESRFDPEIALYTRYRAQGESRPTSLFLYFGHEIPEIDGKNYDASYRERAFTVDDLADGLRHFTRDSAKFDFVVLSTCFNGTPRTVSALTPYARYIMASPGNLHLSYFDLRPFEALDVGLRGGDVLAFARKCAQASFDRLAEDIQTEITVAVYDVGRVQPYLSSVASDYDEALRTLHAGKPVVDEHCDCAEDSVYVRPGMSEGVDILFRSARFGRTARKQTHSGWECPVRPK